MKSSLGLLNNVQDVLLDNIVTSEGPVSVEQEKFSLQVEKVIVKRLGQKKNTLMNCDFQPPPAQGIGLAESKSFDQYK